jgi:hypothetical protein
VDRLHQLGADVEQALEERDVAADHLAQVVTGRERGSGGLQDDRARLGFAAHALQRGDQLLHQLEAQRVAPLGAVEGHAHGRPVLADEHGGAGGNRAHGFDDTPVGCRHV